jgi:hypothetical protein
VLAETPRVSPAKTHSVSLGTSTGTSAEYQRMLADASGGFFYMSPLSTSNRLQVGHNAKRATYLNKMGTDSGYPFKFEHNQLFN